MRKWIGASVAALGLAATAIVAAPAAQAVDSATYGDNCIFGSKGEVLTCLSVVGKSSAKSMKPLKLQGYMSPTVVLNDPAMKGQKVCLYRVHQPGSKAESDEIKAICVTPNATTGEFAMTAKLGFVGTYSYVVGPKKVKANKGEVWYTPDVQLTTKK